MTWRKALLQLAAIQSWMHASTDREGRPYGPGFFRHSWHTTLFASNRKVVLRLIRSWRCIACGEELPVDSEGDHVIPRAGGGEDEASNFLPLCPSCNSSKGARDMMTWWHAKGRSLSEMGPDAIATYARLTWHFLRAKRGLDEETPTGLGELIEGFGRRLPPRHREALSEVGEREKKEGTEHVCRG